MSTFEDTQPNASLDAPVEKSKRQSILSRFLSLISSVRLGVILLIILGLACLLGMLIMQQNVDGFDAYFAELTPAQRLVYGNLGFFDIYHAWYFNALLGLVSLNIILASIDRFPKTLKFITNRKLEASARWISGQKASDSFVVEGETRQDVANTVIQACKKAGWRKTTVTEKRDRTVIFAESGAWNRLGAYAVHVGLLTIFLGGFLTAQFGHTGQMPLRPGQSSNQINELVFDLDRMNQITKQLPFEIYCTDIQQKLIKKDGSISANNTIDWLTQIRIKDETGVKEGIVHMNKPLDYRGYRFFQASFVPVGRARNINVRLKSAKDGTTQDVKLRRDGETILADGTKIKFDQFRANFNLGNEDPNEDTSGYPNPAAVLQVTAPNEDPQTAYAFGPQMADIPMAGKPVGGYTYQMTEFEKVADQHVLSVQRDPGANVVYIGFTLLSLTLVAVFFFSHQRVWTVIEKSADKKFNIIAGGNANRSQNAFEEKFIGFIKDLGKQNREAREL